MDGSTAPRSGPAFDTSGAFMLFVTILAFFLPLLRYFPPVPPSQRDALLETHTQVGVGPSGSGLQKRKKAADAGSDDGDGHDGRDGAGRRVNRTNSGPGSGSSIRSLWIYPIKSCKGIEVRQSKVLATGLEFDRLYTFAQLKDASPSPGGDKNKAAPSWHFITQRQFPLLATVAVDLFVPDIVKARGQAAKVPEPFLLVRFPRRESGLRGALAWLAAKLARGWSARPEYEFVLPAAFPSKSDMAARGYRRDDLTVWRDTVAALNMTSDLPRELALYLGVQSPLGLFRVDPARLRNVYRCAPSAAQAGYQPVTGFQDAYPLHLLNLTSLREFETKVDKDEDLRELDPRRFRANIIVDGGSAPYDEETWKKIRFLPAAGSTRDASAFHVSCRTVRCKLPNVDQDTGYRHPVEPDRALRKYREVDEGARLKGCLGMQVTPLFSKTDAPEDLESWVEVGMSVEVLERGEHKYIPQ